MKDVEILRSFGVLNRTFLTYFSRALAEEGLSYSEGILLANIGERPSANQEALALELVIDKAAVARAVKGLKQKGFIRVKRAATDRRANELLLTRAGERLLAEIAVWNDTWVRIVTASLSASERKVLYRVLGKLVASATRTTPEAQRETASSSRRERSRC